MDLQTLNGLGLPGWFVIIAALVFILKQVGLLDFVLVHFKSQRQLEHEQVDFERQQTEARNAAEQSEQVALWSQTTQLVTVTIKQNEKLFDYIISNHEKWHSEHSARLDEIVKCQRQIFDELGKLTSKFAMMVGVIEAEHNNKKIN